MGQLEAFWHQRSMSRALKASWQRAVQEPKRGLAQSGQLRIGAADTTLRLSEPRLDRS